MTPDFVNKVHLPGDPLRFSPAGDLVVASRPYHTICECDELPAAGFIDDLARLFVREKCADE